MSKTVTVPISEVWHRLINDRSVKVIVPADKLSNLIVGLHKRRASERKTLSALGVEELAFDKGDSIRVITDHKYGTGGTDGDGNVCVTIVIAPRPQQQYVILDEADDGAT